MEPLAFKHALTLRDDPDYNSDVAKLIATIQSNPRVATVVASSTAKLPSNQSSRQSNTSRNVVISVAIAAVLVLAGLVILSQFANGQAQVQQTETAVRLLVESSTASVVASVPTKTDAPTETSMPTATETTAPTLTATGTLTASPSPTSLVSPSPIPTTSPPTTIAAVSTLTNTSSASATPSVAKNFPCDAVVIDPDPQRPSAIVREIYDAMPATTKSGESIRVGSGVKVQRLQYDTMQTPYYLISEEGKRLGWIAASYLKLNQNCTQ